MLIFQGVIPNDNPTAIILTIMITPTIIPICQHVKPTISFPIISKNQDYQTENNPTRTQKKNNSKNKKTPATQGFSQIGGAQQLLVFLPKLIILVVFWCGIPPFKETPKKVFKKFLRIESLRDATFIALRLLEDQLIQCCHIPHGAAGPKEPTQNSTTPLWGRLTEAAA